MRVPGRASSARVLRATDGAGSAIPRRRAAEPPGAGKRRADKARATELRASRGRADTVRRPDFAKMRVLPAGALWWDQPAAARMFPTAVPASTRPDAAAALVSADDVGW